MSSNNLFKNAVEGAAKGALEWTSEKIVSLVKKIKEKRLAFIQERKTIEIVKELYNSGETQFYKRYIQDRELLFIVRMGLTLKKREGDEERLHNLRGKILSKYKVKVLHIAEFVQNSILNRYVGILIDELPSIKDLGKEIEEVLKNIEKHVIFVKGTDRTRETIRKSINIINVHSPFIFIVSGTKSAAKIVKSCVEKLEDTLEDYALEKVSGEEKEILFFKRKI